MSTLIHLLSVARILYFALRRSNKHTEFSFVVAQIGTRSFPSGLVACICMLKNSISPGTRSMLHAPHTTKSSNSKNAITVSVIFRLRANGRNNSQHCCDNNVRSFCSVLAVVCKRMQQLPTMLGPAVHRGKDTTHKTLQTMCNARAWPHQYWKSCANGSNVVALRFGDHGTKEMLGIVGSNV